ncbi:flagellar associated protein [Monoraphidium neglectum]|uniref:Cilia- and flagella-associated protein 53 n=1 Tax=Monoraphidium neglectum TaxID=145388 RepID=A0A0D2KVA4_9CHLO|nr:flagellar associated protein [Monoraphidium neglectum]KIY99318.1 flagellar associated protein [Monoraphidium neglectum]|eukprot:XP_013898338.1 flagellar associated protein [Monoraphidium neglectum]
MTAKKPPPDARITKIREYEDRMQQMQQAAKEESKLGSGAAWQHKTDARIQRNAEQACFEALRAARAGEIELRRERLAQKLAEEEQALKEELAAAQQTPAQRRAAMAERAREMAVRREGERQALAQELLDAAFRDNCDPLRERYSRQITQRTQHEWGKQLEERRSTMALAAKERRLEDAMFAEQTIRAEQRHQDDLRRQKESTQAVKASLDGQVHHVRERQAAEAEADAREVAAMRAHWERLEADAAAADAAERERLRRLAAEVKEFNRLKLAEMSAAERRERELNLRILQDALAREAAEEAADQAAREAKRQEVLHYRHQLALSMQREAEAAGERDLLIERANREKQAAQDAEWAAREEARRRLMAEVDAIRRVQIAYKQEQKRLGKESKRQELDQAIAAERREEAEAAAAAAEARRKALQQSLDVKTQVMARAHLRAAAAEDKVHAAELAHASEERYLQRVAAAEQRIAPPTFFGRKKVEWMH